ncbi:MAG: hypothetical protein AAFU65_02770, partial [Pseudomonadota bacterium]
IRQVEAAVRYARSRANTSGQRHGVQIDATDSFIRVFRLDADGNMQFDVLDPVARQPYTLALGQGALAPATNARLDVDWAKGCSVASTIAFDPAGFVRCVNPLSSQALTAKASIAVGDRVYSLTIDGPTGRFVRLRPRGAYASEG